MKKIVFAFLIASGLVSCNDGDVIFTSFDFDEINLQHCGKDVNYVIIKVNNGTFESLSLNLRTPDSILNVADTTTYDIGGNNLVHYRKYRETVGSSYFCSLIPPTEPAVSQEFISTGGTAEVITK